LSEESERVQGKEGKKRLQKLIKKSKYEKKDYRFNNIRFERLFKLALIDHVALNLIDSDR
jgi:hypothetical protein